MLLQSKLRREELHPLSRACVDLGDGLLDELICEVASACAPQPLDPQQMALLEGLPSDEHGAVPARLRALTAVEQELSERCETRMRTAMAACGHALAARPKSSSSDLLVTCTNCSTQVSAPRFAKHLQDCMLGRGRAASRAANQSLRDQAAREANI
jgi:hypothetical protein